MSCSLIEDIVECYHQSGLENPYSTFVPPPKEATEKFWFDWLRPEIAQQLRFPEDTEDALPLSVEGEDNLQQPIEGLSPCWLSCVVI